MFGKEGRDDDQRRKAEMKAAEQTKSGRWIYYAERKLTSREVRFVVYFFLLVFL